MSIFATMSLRYGFFRRFSSAISYPYPVPRDLSGAGTTCQLRPALMSNADCRPQPLYRTVEFLLNLRDLDTANEYARLAALSRSEILCNSTISTCDSIIGAMCEAKRYKDALYMYHYFFNESKMKPSCKSSNHIIKALCDLGRVDDALLLFHHISPGCVTYDHLTKGLVDAGRIDEALSLVRESVSGDSMSLAYRNLVSGFLNLGKLDMAIQLLDEFKPHGWSREQYNERAMVKVAFVEHWLKQERDEEAMQWYMSLVSNKYLTVYGDTGNALLEVLFRYGKKTQAWELFNQMLDGFHRGCISVNSKTIDIMVKECFKEGQFMEGIETFEKVKAKTKDLRAADYTNLITRCCEQGMLAKAESLYAELSSDRCMRIDVSTYRAMMDAYIKAGRVDDALKTAKNMVDANLTKLSQWTRS
ncbi:PREDICTED: pentatricopeptide repeat-containing protein At1g10270-like [Camelina sativa]|uniref:Pentatricopeptide repeat-containing protein At1g10270-like n=1 Tax=Camelina sativa TaxID=90675 RepID=A0ABM0TUL1_CAMSA|nr:PREDICTED: pentatricopeptide repeat-containing protein At1g10270-like [Camelina sativa]